MRESTRHDNGDKCVHEPQNSVQARTHNSSNLSANPTEHNLNDDDSFVRILKR